MSKNILKFLSRHKFAAFIIILLLGGGGYYGYQYLRGGEEEIRYVLAAVEKGTLTSAVSGSGQVSVSNQVDIKSRVSGDIVRVNAKNGQEVKDGTLLAQIDAKDAQKTVRDAETALETAKLSLEKLKEPPDALTLLQTQNSLTAAKDNLAKLKLSQEIDYQKPQETKQKAEDDLKKAYDDGFNTVANAFLDLANVMTGLNDILYGTTLSGKGQWNVDFYADSAKLYDEKKAFQYRQESHDGYQTARAAYDTNFSDYKAASRFSETSVIESLINETYETTKSIAEAIKNTNTLIQFYEDNLTEHNLKPPTLADTHLSSLNSYTGKTNTQLLNLLSIKRTIQTDKEAIVNAERDLKEMDQNNPLDLTAAGQSIKEKEESLRKLQAGTEALDIRTQELAVKQRENTLLDAKEKLADYSVKALFDGVVAKVNIKKGDTVSANAVIATLITKQRVAEISLNEVDAAKAKIGQKATLTFDAVPDLSISGEAAEIDAIGTVSQGVVSYIVKITFDTQDERVKPGMSVSANIITDVKTDALMVPNSAVKAQENASFVEVPDEEARAEGEAKTTGVILTKSPRRQQVEVGISNDDFTEIISGLKEGDVIITRTVQPNSSSTEQTQTSTFRIPGLPGGGGGRQ